MVFGRIFCLSVDEFCVFWSTCEFFVNNTKPRILMDGKIMSQDRPQYAKVIGDYISRNICWKWWWKRRATAIHTHYKFNWILLSFIIKCWIMYHIILCTYVTNVEVEFLVVYFVHFPGLWVLFYRFCFLFLHKLHISHNTARLCINWVMGSQKLCYISINLPPKSLVIELLLLMGLI